MLCSLNFITTGKVFLFVYSQSYAFEKVYLFYGPTCCDTDML